MSDRMKPLTGLLGESPGIVAFDTMRAGAPAEIAARKGAREDLCTVGHGAVLAAP